MQNTSNLRFLLALGNQKVIVMNNPEGTAIYSDRTNKGKNISLKHLAEAVSAH